MAKCTHSHLIKKGDKSYVQVPCYYIAGVCIVDPIHQGTLEMFLRSTYPFFHSPLYEESKKMKEFMVPNNIKLATENAW